MWGAGFTITCVALAVNIEGLPGDRHLARFMMHHRHAVLASLGSFAGDQFCMDFVVQPAVCCSAAEHAACQSMQGTSGSPPARPCCIRIDIKSKHVLQYSRRAVDSGHIWHLRI